MAFPTLPSSPRTAPALDRRTSAAAQWGLSKADKWKAASHLHKAIRHGLADDAEQGVRWLHELDPAYLRYRMAVIAVEDVAAGSPEVVAEAFSGGWTKMDLAQRGLDFLVGCARAWALARKDRTPCAWLSCTRFRAEFEQRWGSWELLPLRSARNLAFDASLPWWARGLGAWRAAGADLFRHPTLPGLKGDWDAFVAQAREYGLEEAHLRCMDVGRKVQAEAHPIFLPLAVQAQFAEGKQPLDRTVPQLGYAGPWLSAALDKHTSEGKRALGALMRRNRTQVTQLMRHGAQADDVEDAVGRLWFWMEGGVLDRSWAYPQAAEIDRDTKQRVLATARIPARALFEAFGQDLQQWHAVREQTIAHTLRPLAAP